MISIPNTKLLYTKITFVSITVFIIFLFNFSIFGKIYLSSNYSFYIFNEIRYIDNPYWAYIKILHCISLLISWIFFSNRLFQKFFKASPKSLELNKNNYTENLNLKLGINLNTNSDVFIPEKGLYQNILITGTIGTGKTSSAMYPFVEQLIKQNLGMLILDVKGNFHTKVKEFAKKYYFFANSFTLV